MSLLSKIGHVTLHLKTTSGVVDNFDEILYALLDVKGITGVESYAEIIITCEPAGDTDEEIITSLQAIHDQAMKIYEDWTN